MTSMTLFTNPDNAIADLQKAKPQYMQDVDIMAQLAAINEDIQTKQTYPVLSIKGKVFTLKKDGENTPIMRSEDEPAQTINVVAIRANPNARHYYATEYVDGSEGSEATPDCYSNDGVRPAPDAKSPQSDACATCPHAVWGTGKNGIGTACTVNTRLAIVAPEVLASESSVEPSLLRVPAGSRKPFNENVITPAKRNSVPYNAMVIRIGFDYESAGVKLKFKPVGFLSDEAYKKVRDLYDDETVQAIVGVVDSNKEATRKPAPEEAVSETAEASKGALEEKTPAKEKPAKASEKKASKPASKKKSAQPAPAPAPEPEPSDKDTMMSDIDDLLASFDD